MKVFKEWSAVCRALGRGEQTIILRKGGIAEASGEFRPEYAEFALAPTLFHEQQQGQLKPGAEALPAVAGKVRVELAARLVQAYHVTDWEPITRLDHFHIWTEETLRKRFVYREPGLYLLLVRVVRLAEVIEFEETPEYNGCKSWADIPDHPLILGEPVLTDAEFQAIRLQIEKLLRGAIG